jgi:eukaryotic-like serine/threonine-protein kinase
MGTAHRKPLKEWMIEQLGRPGYGMPEQVASAWIELGTILPLLDGLDEVPPHSILGCIHAINAYRPANGIRPSIVVCCRLEDYRPHARQLAVQRVLLIEPPAQAQIDQYLANPKLAGIKQALADDKGLRELGQTPLMLSLMALAFTNAPAPSILIQEGSSDVPLEQRREEFFARYVKVQLAREYRQITGRYRTDDTLRWLSWLANLLHAHNDAHFYVETLQPRLLKHWVLFLITIMIVFGLFDGALFGFIAYWVYGIHVALIVAVTGFLFGSFFGALGGKGVGSIGLRDKLKLDTGTVFVALMYGTVFAIAVGLVYGLFIGVAVGAVVGIIGGLFGSLGSIPLRRGRKIDISGFAVGFIMGYVFNGVYGLIPGILVGFPVGLLIGLAFGSVLDLANSTSQSLRDSGYVRVNSGMLRTRNYGIAFGVLCGGVTGVVIGIEYGVVIGVGVGFVCGLLVSFGVGLGDYVKYCFLRASLTLEGEAPLFYVRFLDEAKDRVFLRRSGGGYEFVHRLIREYFASLHPEFVRFFTSREA